MLAFRYAVVCTISVAALPLLITGCKPAVATGGPGALPKVTVAHPESRTIQDEDDYGGWLRAAETTEIRSRVRGHILDVKFQDGDYVKTGQVLFELDPRPFQAQIEATESSADALKAQHKAAEKELVRYVELVKKNAVSVQDLEKAEADTAALAARIIATQQQANIARLDLEYSSILAPISGRISRAMLTKGNLVNAGGTDPVLTTIVSIDPIYAYFTINERSLQRYLAERRVEDGDKPPPSLRERHIPFRFALDSDDGFPNTGELDYADNQVDSATGSIEIRGTVKNPNGKFVPGSRIQVRVPNGRPYEAIVIPDTAILSDQDRRYVLVLGKDNMVLRRDIIPGRLLDDGSRIVRPATGGAEALTKDDQIITLGLQRARINYPVDPYLADGKPAGKASS
ncbi:efflux RND transporter periplasmic adaptor subunit [Anatilimnocola sp. NA78]|uniref:efflux RND transporter periplasmic adaptor subunit n=1 Tax=Anatilimnocola sp. NA78 TaxID=3415683 RepID=UPI003CE4DBB0